MPPPRCAFCAIVAGSEAAAIVASDDAGIAFLDAKPLFPGHCLVVPRVHHETLTDLPSELVGPVFSLARAVASAVERALGARGTFVAMNNRVSQSVPHMHVHVVPRNPKDGLRGFFWPRSAYRDAAHLEEVRAAIAAGMESAR